MKSDKGDNEEFSKTILRSISVMIEGMHGSRQREAKKKAEEDPNKENGEVSIIFKL